MPSEQEDRALVERVWVWHQQRANGSICIALDVRMLFLAYADAAEYTRKALAKVAEIESEIALEQQVISWLSSDSSMRSMYAQRTLERLQAALREARKGMKEGK